MVAPFRLSQAGHVGRTCVLSTRNRTAARRIDTWDEAIAKFAATYGDQTEWDHDALSAKKAWPRQA
jgi:hypothetical protein